MKKRQKNRPRAISPAVAMAMSSTGGTRPASEKPPEATRSTARRTSCGR